MTPDQSVLWQAWLSQQQGANAQAQAEALRNAKQQQAQAAPTQRRIVEGRVVERRMLTPEEAAAVQAAYLWDAE